MLSLRYHLDTLQVRKYFIPEISIYPSGRVTSSNSLCVLMQAVASGYSFFIFLCKTSFFHYLSFPDFYIDTQHICQYYPIPVWEQLWSKHMSMVLCCFLSVSVWVFFLRDKIIFLHFIRLMSWCDQDISITQEAIWYNSIKIG